MNKLETELSQNDLNSLFSTKVEKVNNNLHVLKIAFFSED